MTYLFLQSSFIDFQNISFIWCILNKYFKFIYPVYVQSAFIYTMSTIFLFFFSHENTEGRRKKYQPVSTLLVFSDRFGSGFENNVMPAALKQHAHTRTDTHRGARLLTLAHMMFVSDSATVSRAMAAGSSRPFIGCSPQDVAMPVVERWLEATTPQSARGVCRGPTHCCCATSPVTERSTCCAGVFYVGGMN